MRILIGCYFKGALNINSGFLHYNFSIKGGVLRIFPEIISDTVPPLPLTADFLFLGFTLITMRPRISYRHYHHSSAQLIDR